MVVQVDQGEVGIGQVVVDHVVVGQGEQEAGRLWLLQEEVLPPPRL